MAEYNRKSVPKRLKQLIWNKYIGEENGVGVCQCCKVSEISQMDFHCGHIIASSRGGEMTLDNLIPLCAQCNLSMGSQDYYSFSKYFNNSQKRPQEQPYTQQKIIPTITMETILGKYLDDEKTEDIEQIINFDEEEKIELIYKVGGFDDDDYEVIQSTIVGITNKRIFRIEDGEILKHYFSQIESCKHEKKNIFRWDQLVITTKKHTNVKYGIYFSETAKYFNKYLNGKLM